MDNLAILQKAKNLIDKGSCKAAYDLLVPLILENDSEALFLYSQFGFDQSETNEMFEKRSIELLKRSADMDFAPAIYALGVCYEAGDLVESDEHIAAKLFEKAAMLGHSKARYMHGLNLFYGSSGVPKNLDLALDFIRSAADDGIDDAVSFLNEND